jgi:L-galactose dehydrogenase
MATDTHVEVSEYRKLGQTDLRVSPLGFGTSPLGDVFGATDPVESTRAVHYAIDHGINFFDTSPYYGSTLAEQRLGEALQGARDQVVLATKIGRYGLINFDFSAKRVIASIDESLKRLKTDRLDLLQVHDVEFGDFRQLVEETIPTLRNLQKAGKARYIGITGYPPKFLVRVASQVPVDTILNYCHYNLLTDEMDRVLTPFARENFIGLINASALHMGVLTERGAPPWHPASLEVLNAGRRLASLCRERGQSISAVAVRFCLDHPYASTTLVGMGTLDEVKANLRLLQLKSDESILREIGTAIGSAFNCDWPSGKPENNGVDGVV